MTRSELHRAVRVVVRWALGQEMTPGEILMQLELWNLTQPRGWTTVPPRQHLRHSSDGVVEGAMTRDEAIAKIRPFLPTNPTHPSTHVSIPLEALKVLLAEAANCIDPFASAKTQVDQWCGKDKKP